MTPPPDALAYVLARIHILRTLEVDPTRRSSLANLGVRTKAGSRQLLPDAVSASPLENATTLRIPRVKPRDPGKSGPTFRPNQRMIHGTRAHLWLAVHHHVNRRTQVRSIYALKDSDAKRQSAPVTSVTSAGSDPPKRMSRILPKLARSMVL